MHRGEIIDALGKHSRIEEIWRRHWCIEQRRRDHCCTEKRWRHRWSIDALERGEETSDCIEIVGGND